jgi:hypothetical protein
VSQPDLGQLLARAREVQERLAGVQRDLAACSVEGSAGAGLVTAVASGALRILKLRIDPSLLASGDRGMLEDLVAAAVNAALEKAQLLVQEELQRASLALGAPGPRPEDPR